MEDSSRTIQICFAVTLALHLFAIISLVVPDYLGLTSGSLLVLIIASFISVSIGLGLKYFFPEKLPVKSSNDPVALKLDGIPTEDFNALNQLIRSTESHLFNVQEAAIASGSDVERDYHREGVRSHMESMMNGQDLFGRLSERLRKLLNFSRENANFAAANRLDWQKNKMIGQLSQIRQAQDKVHNTVKQVAATHDSTMRLLGNCLQSDLVLGEKITRVQSHLQQVLTTAQNGYQSHDNLVVQLGTSLESMATAARYVSGVTQRIESLNLEIQRVTSTADQLQRMMGSLTLKLNKSLVDAACKELSQTVVNSTNSLKSIAKGVKDLSSNVQEEVERALHQLSDSTKKTDAAFSSVNSCGEVYRDSVTASKYSLSELNLLIKEIEIHVKRLGETKELGVQTSGVLTDLDPILTMSGGLNTQIATDANELAAHCDRLAQLLAKQYYELSHCEKMSSDGARFLKGVREEFSNGSDSKGSFASMSFALDGGVSQKRLKTLLERGKSALERLEHRLIPTSASANIEERKRSSVVDDRRNSGTPMMISDDLEEPIPLTQIN